MFLEQGVTLIWLPHASLYCPALWTYMYNIRDSVSSAYVPNTLYLIVHLEPTAYDPHSAHRLMS
jgi:hypothetical protein